MFIKRERLLQTSYLVMYILENGLSGKPNRDIGEVKKSETDVVRTSSDQTDKRKLQTVGRTFPVWNRYSCNCKNKCQRKKLS